jgi:hypothetical protein
MTEISFVIVNYNSLDFIKNLLESFKLIDVLYDGGISEYKKTKKEPQNSNNLQFLLQMIITSPFTQVST